MTLGFLTRMIKSQTLLEEHAAELAAVEQSEEGTACYNNVVGVHVHSTHYIYIYTHTRLT